ncbi:MAG: stage III sporulation protein AB [Lachnospiraceae bacterium]
MLKIFGALLICVSSTLIGVELVREMRQRVQVLKEIKKMLLLIRGEIQFAATSLTDLFLEMGGKMEHPLDELACQVGRKLSEQDGASFAQVWEAEFCDGLRKQVTALTKEDIQCLEGIGELSGTPDRAMQLGTIDLYLERLEPRIQEAADAVISKAKMYHCVGAMCGVLLVLLLI